MIIVQCYGLWEYIYSYVCTYYYVYCMMYDIWRSRSWLLPCSAHYYNKKPSVHMSAWWNFFFYYIYYHYCDQWWLLVQYVPELKLICIGNHDVNKAAFSFNSYLFCFLFLQFIMINAFTDLSIYELFSNTIQY